MLQIGPRSAFATLFLFLFSAYASAQTSQNIYRLVISECGGASGRYVQSAFKLSGTGTLFTALHGVAGCSSIEAYDFRGAPAFDGRKFKITRADVPHDVAELVSDPALPTQGGFVGAAREPTPFELLLVYGFPSGRVISRGTEVHVADPPLISLNSWPMNDDVRNALHSRMSPDPGKVDFVDIDGTLLPGHSGAPLLNSAHQVVAVADGGLEGGKDNRAWAVPWSRIQLGSFDQAASGQLGRAPAVLFAYDPEADELPAIATQAVAAGTQDTISLGHTGYIPGLRGELNPILDSSNRTYLYARNVAINGGLPQPVPFALNQALQMEDSEGNLFSITIASITTTGATITYKKLSSNRTSYIGQFKVRAEDEAGIAVPGASVEVTFSDGTLVSTATDAQGQAVLSGLKRPVGDVVVTHPGFVAVSAPAEDLHNPLTTRLRHDRTGGSLTLAGNTGEIPGLDGRLNPIRDSSNRAWLYADNISIAGKRVQPAMLSLNTPFEVEDSHGSRFAVTVTSINNSSSVIAYESLPARRDGEVANFEVSVSDVQRAPVSGADVVVAFKDGTVLATKTTAQGIARFQQVKQRVADIFVALVGYSAVNIVDHDARQALSVTIRSDGNKNSGVFVGRAGYIPGLDGQLTPILDEHDQYLWAAEIQINENSPQPVHYSLGESLRLRDRTGVVFQMTVLAMTGYATLFEYGRISP